ncbi:MAG: phosphoglucosamine mutase [Actinomycetales bacterium]|nr:phosphoglucosamine mutase [Actinomycetales bacterium]
MQKRLFGTDGIRGLANRDLTAELALNVSVAAAHILIESNKLPNNQRPKAIVGSDSRASGEFLEAAVVAGLSSAGVDVYRVGVLPTPAIAYLVAQSGADLGVMLSASHNPMPDNGIKLFARGGGKLDDAIEDQIQARMSEPWERPTGRGVGRVIEDKDAANRYIQYLLSTVTQKLDGFKVVVDCANGAASFVAPEALRQAGAEVIAIANTPDGWNINDGVGSTHLDFLKAAVKKNGADLGIAHDGDADRCLAVDADGNEVDGDQIIAILATGLNSRDELPKSTVVATVMSNLGFFKAMESAGIKVEVTSVGDRYVLEKMISDDLALGGEQSGHVIYRKFANTGDGILTALMLLQEVKRSGKSLKDAAAIMQKFPQVLINVKDVAKEKLSSSEVIKSAVEKSETDLAGAGRVLLRASGTEALVRVMVEASTDTLASSVAEQLAEVVKRELGS